MDHKNSQSASYAAAGVDITAGYRAVELMKKHIARTRNEGCLDDVGGFGGCFGLPIAGMEEPVLVTFRLAAFPASPMDALETLAMLVTAAVATAVLTPAPTRVALTPVPPM